MKLLLFFLTLLPFIYSQSACQGTWSAWITSIPCNDTCGMCGVETQARSCQPAGCSCDEQTAFCGKKVCIFPRESCRHDNVKAIDTTNQSFTIICVTKIN